jgi:hypothetical protein
MIKGVGKAAQKGHALSSEIKRLCKLLRSKWRKIVQVADDATIPVPRVLLPDSPMLATQAAHETIAELAKELAKHPGPVRTLAILRELDTETMFIDRAVLTDTGLPRMIKGVGNAAQKGHALSSEIKRLCKLLRSKWRKIVQVADERGTEEGAEVFCTSCGHKLTEDEQAFARDAAMPGTPEPNETSFAQVLAAVQHRRIKWFIIDFGMSILRYKGTLIHNKEVRSKNENTREPLAFDVAAWGVAEYHEREKGGDLAVLLLDIDGPIPRWAETVKENIKEEAKKIIKDAVNTRAPRSYTATPKCHFHGGTDPAYWAAYGDRKWYESFAAMAPLQVMAVISREVMPRDLS